MARAVAKQRVTDRKAWAQQQLRRALMAACEQELNCTPHWYGGGAAALFFESNWTAPDGIARVVMACNTTLAGSLPVAALLWNNAELEALDLERESFEAAAARGRLFIFTSSVSFPSGERFAVLPAAYSETDDSPLGLWTFATAGLYRNEAFLTTRGGVGTFASAALDSWCVFRPNRFDSASGGWAWAGRSSSRVGDLLRLTVEAPFATPPRQYRSVFLPPLPNCPNLAAIRCIAIDHNSDPVGITDKRPRKPCQIVRIDGRPYLYARPNQRDHRGRLLFAMRATHNAEAMSTFDVAFDDGATDIVVEFPANHRDRDGNYWFIRFPTAKDEKSGLPIVLIPLEVL